MTRFLIFFVVAFSIAMGIVFASEMAINGGRVTISGGYMDFGTRETERVVVSTMTGQCIGILCGVTYKQ